ncbi:hypothetical protein LTR56_018604 [Elasticomyces elasticus]|nr:hypothetical protein LTR56_018604 [Elasticomyces elasticus]KAK3647367.1 hypothetical protein LTR22_013798 [Elasticomyces elasticus]KAK4917647.1 hypothetical protein LTR49_014469 [Elasticomyces elasticus]KAK5752034.1 hypothetical protein LTS12_017884 [Elasticomyces elasticus]
MQFFITSVALLMAASSAIAAPSRRQATADTKIRVILRDNVGGKQEVVFANINSNIGTGVSGTFTTLEVDVGTDQDSTLRCAVQGADGANIFARRGVNLDDTFSDSTNGEWTFDGPVAITDVICDLNFAANNRNVAA